MTRKSTAWLLLVLIVAGVPFTMGCWQCEGGPIWTTYARDMASVTLDAGTTAHVPLEVSVPVSTSTDNLAVEIALTDCTAGALSVEVSARRADGTLIAASRGGGAAGPTTVRCPADVGAVFELSPGDLSCGTMRCATTLDIQVTSTAGLGPRELEARLDRADCRSPVRGDGTIELWGN